MTDRLDTIALFVAVADHGSFAAAARRLHRTPAAVTRAVAALEQALGTRLLNRTTRSVALTDEGARTLDACRRVLAAYDAVRGIEPAAGGEPHGLLTVTAPAMFGRLHVLPAIAAYLRRHPRVEVRALLLDRVVSLLDEGLDVGVRLGELPDSSLRAVRVGSVYRSVYASPAYLEARGTPETPQALRGHDIVGCSAITPQPDRWTFRAEAASVSVALKPRLVLNTTEAAADAAADGLGLVCLVSYQAAAHVEAGRLVRVLAAFEPPPIPIHIVHPAGRFLPAKVRAFIDTAAEVLRQRFG